MKAKISKTFRFEASHQLPNHDGKCRFLHGHSYRAEIIVYGQVRPADGTSKEGMVVDFNDIKAVWRDIEPLLDHKHLNDSLGGIVTTAENIACWILSAFLEHGVSVNKVRLWETETSMAEVDHAEVWANGPNLTSEDFASVPSS